MTMATRKAHWDKPIWVTEGGAELPVTNIAASTALIVGGPGKYSLDRIFGTRLPAWVAPLGLALVILTTLYAERLSEDAQQREEEAREELAGEE